MKKHILFIKAFFSIIISFGQNGNDTSGHTRWIPGLNIGAMNDGISRGATYSHFTLEKGQTFFSIGPVLGANKNLQHAYHDYYYYDTYSLNGARVVFQVISNPGRKFFQPYYHTELAFHRFSDKGSTQEISTDYEEKFIATPISYNHTQTAIGAYMGWGFKTNLPGNFYVNQNLAFGVIDFYTVKKFELSEYNRKFNHFSLDFLLKLGVGFRFNKKPEGQKSIFKELKQKRPDKDNLDAFIDSDIAQITNPRYNDSIALKKYFWGINVGAIPVQNFGFDYYGNITVHRGQNKLALGPIIGNGAEISDKGFINRFDGRPGFRGFNIMYQRTPLQYRRAELGFQYDFIYKYYTEQGERWVYQSNNSQYLVKNYKSKVTYIKNYVGYALRENLFKGLYLNQSAGLGIACRSWDIDYQDTKYNIHGNKVNLELLIRLGIGYRLNYNPAYFKPEKHRFKSDSVSSKKTVWSIGAGILPYLAFDRTVSYFNLAAEKGKNSFEAGLLSGKIHFDGPGVLNKDNYGLTGINLVYNRIPASYSERFKFYFQNLLCINYSSFSGSNTVPVWGQYVIKNYKAYQASVSDYLGYGCKINIFNQLYVDQCFGLGMIYRYYTVDFENGYYTYENQDRSLALLLKLGVGYRFK